MASTAMARAISAMTCSAPAQPKAPINCWATGTSKNCPMDPAAVPTPGATKLAIVCEVATRKIGIVRATSAAKQGEVAMRISTETTSRPMMAKPASGSPARVLTTLDARDPLLDAMAITRGRFAVEVEGEPGLYVPAWAEVTRVIEDCR